MMERNPERRKNLNLRKQIDDYEGDAREAAMRAKTAQDETQRQKLLDIAESLAALVARLKQRARTPSSE
jgi:hypothetical protein